MGNSLGTSLTSNRNRIYATLGLALISFASGCAQDLTGGAALPAYCAPSTTAKTSLTTGAARVFSPDPIVASGNPGLSPTDANLDSYAQTVALGNLTGYGILQGKYVDVHDGGACGQGYGEYDAKNQFVYPHSDLRFQDAMAYYWGDSYRTRLATTGYLQPAGSVQIYAHCQAQENAYVYKGTDSTGAPVERVCLGYSAATEGAYYADDATVTVHELEHATTTDSYAPGANGRLNEFWYDEAGSLNEAISDFMALMYEQPFLTSAFDPKLFSRWALGTFIPNRSGTRGANRCPAYDPTYPNCTGYPSFSAANNTISYVYPDGVGWPYANNFQGPGYAASAFSIYPSQEEIHNAGVLLEGALWDVYDAIKANHGGDDSQAQTLTTQIVLEAVKHLPQQNLNTSPPALSPVGFQGLASQMSLYASAVGLNAADQNAMNAALTARGLLGGTQLDASWAAVGPGNSTVTPGIRVQDNPTELKVWVTNMFGDPAATSLVPQGIDTGLNGKMDPGELVAVWFDLQNGEATTAGDVLLTVTALDPQATFDESANIGWISATQSQIAYGKVNGTAIVTALSSANPALNVGTGNSYFRTNPFFDHSWSTALWVRVSASAAHGSTVRFQVQAQPSNGAASTATFTATIN
jgi:hypothetical protein